MNNTLYLPAEQKAVLWGRRRKGACTHMEKQSGGTRSYLFTIRVWEEEVGQDATEWRGKVQLMSNGEARYFREWTGLVSLLQRMLAQVEPAEPDEQKGE
jgi:hypothetical protein